MGAVMLSLAVYSHAVHPHSQDNGALECCGYNGKAGTVSALLFAFPMTLENRKCPGKVGEDIEECWSHMHS